MDSSIMTGIIMFVVLYLVFFIAMLDDCRQS